MKDLFFKLHLEATVDIGKYKKGDMLTLYSSIFNRDNGLVYWHLHPDWEIISKHQYIGVDDKYGEKIYEGDRVLVSIGKKSYETKIILRTDNRCMFCLEENKTKFNDGVLISKMLEVINEEDY